MAASEHRLCVNNGCGFFGRPATLNLCSNCYRELDPDGAMLRSLPRLKIPPRPPVEVGTGLSSGGGGDDDDDGAATTEKRVCGLCNRKLGMLSEFECRCGGTYCMGHRLPENHTCTFDFTAVADKLAGQGLIT